MVIKSVVIFYYTLLFYPSFILGQISNSKMRTDCLLEINEEYKYVNIAAFEFVIPKKNVVSNKIISYNYCDSLTFIVKFLGLSLTLHEYEQFGLNSLCVKDFNNQNCCIEKTMKNGCFDSLKLYLDLKIPIKVNGKWLNTSVVENQLGDFKKIRSIRKRRNIFNGNVLYIETE